MGPVTPSNRRRNAVFFAFAVGVPLLKAGWAKLKEVAKPPARVCPACTFRTVEAVGAVLTKKGRVLRYHRCTACRAHYRSVDNGAFTRPSDREWATRVGWG